MIGLLQRVSRAAVTVAGRRVAAIDRGLLVLVGVERGDGPAHAVRLAERLLSYRVFPDAAGRMNLDVRAAGGAVLLVPQFTLAADTRKGSRPSFSEAADPEAGARGFEALVEALRGREAESGVPVRSGVFGADMQVELVNDGPVTFWLQARAEA